MLQRKADAFAEHVDGIDEAFVGERGQHGVADFVDVSVGTAGEFGRQCMRAEKRRVDGHGIALAQLTRDAQHLAFAGEVEPVAGFDLDRRHAFGEQGFEPRGRLAEQRGFVRRTRGAHRGDDAAALPRDLFVADAREALREFVRALAAIHQMRMAIDETRRHPRAVQIFARPCGVVGG